jgi:phosphatidylserine/phosphatidylglycerophosphate/cardiolipin synthase-like enzyme
VSLHAKCVVVDERWSLVTSANFTNRAQTRNIELGVLIDDEPFAQKITGQWRALVRASHVIAGGHDDPGPAARR